MYEEMGASKGYEFAPNAMAYLANDFTIDEVKDIKKCKDDVVHFASKININPDSEKLGHSVKLYAKQKRILETYASDRRVYLNSSRQVGKTTLDCIFALWTALNNSDKRVAILSNKENSSKLLLSRIRKFYDTLDPKYFSPIKEFTKTRITFANGSTIMCETASCCVLRGCAIDVLILTEAAFFRDFYGMWEAVWPTIASRKNSKAIISTTGSENQDDQLTKFWHEDNHWTKIKYHWVEIPRYGIDGYDPEGWKDAQVRLIGKESFLWEFCCKMPPRKV